MKTTHDAHPFQTSIPGKRDCGQRFKVSYVDGLGKRRAFGFTDDREVAESFVDQINRNPMWKKPRLTDRREVA